MGSLLMIVQQLCFSAELTAVHQIGHGMAPWQLAFIRGVGGIGLAFVVARFDWRECLRIKRYGLQALRALCATAYGLVLAYSFSRLPLADASALSYTMVPMVMVLSPLILGEVVTWQHWCATALGFTGALLTLRPSLGGEPLIYALVFAGNSMNALVFVLNRVLRTETQSSVLLTGSVAQVCVYSTASLTIADTLSWLWVGPLVFGPLGTYFGLLAARHGLAVNLAPINYLRLPIMVLIAVGVYLEPFNWLAVFGAVLICSGDLFVVFQRARRAA